MAPPPSEDHAAVEQMQRRRNEARFQHIFNRNRVTKLRQRIHRRMPAHGHGDFRQLLTGRAKLVHVPLGRECIIADRRWTIRSFQIARKDHPH